MEKTKLVERPNSVEISINAKQMFSGKVKVYADTIDEAINQAMIKGEELQKLIDKKNAEVA